MDSELNKTTTVPVRMDDELLSEIDKKAKEVKKTRSRVIRTAIRIGLPEVK